MKHSIINTRDIPQTFPILNQTLPSVLQSMCYNDDNFPFCQEVLHTEVGHLFEHILIEYLCLQKVSLGFDNVEYSGITKWNWIIYPKGTFHITVSAGLADTTILVGSMAKSISLINRILASVKSVPLDNNPLNQAYMHPTLTPDSLTQPLVS